MSSRLLPVTLVLLLAAPLFSAQEYAARRRGGLDVGKPAPPLAVEKWIKGSPVPAFEKGKVYVVDFWATWCPPCIASMPHLSALQRAYAEKGVTLIGLTTEDKRNSLEQVEKMVSEKGDVMGYTVAWDKGDATYAAYMHAAGQSSIPTAFVIDGAGVVAYIGHPVFLDEPLAEVLAGTWDLEKDPAQLAADQEEFFRFYGAVGSDPKGTLEQLSAFEKRHPQLVALTDPLRFMAELAAGEAQAALATGTRITERSIAARDAALLNELARTIVAPERTPAQGELDLALRAAEKAAEFTASKDDGVLDILAHVHFARGDVGKAVATETLAVTVAPDKRKAGLMRTLEEFQMKSRK